MPGTIEGGMKAAETNKKNSKDFYIKLGRIGGKVKNPNKGFGSMDKDKLKEISSKGGRRKKKVTA